jgi:DtxR family Mn-dependent transcriptional regulator
MSEAVERRVLVLLDNPTVSPYGNPIPGLEELDATLHAPAFKDGGLLSLREVTEGLADGGEAVVVVRRIGEPVQTDGPAMHRLRRVGVRPGGAVHIEAADGGVLITSGGEATEIDLELAGHVFVEGRAS